MVAVVVGALGQASSRSQVRVGINYVSFLGWGKQDLPARSVWVQFLALGPLGAYGYVISSIQKVPGDQCDCILQGLGMLHGGEPWIVLLLLREGKALLPGLSLHSGLWTAKTIFKTLLRPHSPFSLSLSYECTEEFPTGFMMGQQMSSEGEMRVEPGCPALKADALPSEPLGKL